MASRKRKRVSTASAEHKGPPAAKRAKKDDPDAFYFMGNLFSRGVVTFDRVWHNKPRKVNVSKVVRGRHEVWAQTSNKTRQTARRKEEWFDPSDRMHQEAIVTPFRDFHSASGRVAAIGGFSEGHTFEIVPRLTFEDSEVGRLTCFLPYNDDDGLFWGVNYQNYTGAPERAACWFWLDNNNVDQKTFEEFEGRICEELSKEYNMPQPLCNIILTYAWLDWRNIKQAVELLRAPLLAECLRP